MQRIQYPLNGRYNTLSYGLFVCDNTFVCGIRENGPFAAQKAFHLPMLRDPLPPRHKCKIPAVDQTQKEEASITILFAFAILLILLFEFTLKIDGYAPKRFRTNQMQKCLFRCHYIIPTKQCHNSRARAYFYK